jgi:hypothetical protein
LKLYSDTLVGVIITGAMIYAGSHALSGRVDGHDCKSTLNMAASVNPRASLFKGHDAQTQYVIYICGVQQTRPAIDGLAAAYAMEGKKAVPFLKQKLAAAKYDLTIKDIMKVFEEMARRGTYDVAGDAELMDIMTYAIPRIKTRGWEVNARESLSVILQSARK